MERTRLCIVTDAWLPQVNGVVTTLTNIKQQAENDGWEVLIIHPGLFKNISAPYYNEIKLCWPRGLKKMVRDFNPDHLHIATEGPLGFAARVSFRRLVFTTAYHTRWAPFLKDILKIPEFITWSYLRWFHNNGKVMVPTESIKQEVIDKRFSREVVLFGRGVDTTVLVPNKRKKLNIKPVLLCVSRVSKEKNLDVFCRLNPNLYDLILVGDGPYLDELKNKYSWVIFKGKLTGTELANEYQNADVFVFPSIKDTYGIVMIESMSLGTPVAAFPVAGPIDIINKNTGVMNKDINKAILKALDLDRKLVKQYALENYTWVIAWNQFKSNLLGYEDDGQENIIF